MIISKTPLRVSLAGGSTDLQGYLDIYGEGRVISFTPNLFTYIILKKSSTKYYKIVYSRIENVISYGDIQNDIAREVISYFNMPPVEVIFTADIPSSGSGLASSSSYLISMIKACSIFKGQSFTKEEIGKIAIEIERKFNPLTGYQDIYGCVYSGLKQMTFDVSGIKDVFYFSKEIFDASFFYLVSIGKTRNSTDVLSTIDFSKVHKLSGLTEDMHKALLSKNCEAVYETIKRGWEIKKSTSKNIINKEIKRIEERISEIPHVKAWRLVGAGNGGYFLVISDSTIEDITECYKLDLYEE